MKKLLLFFALALGIGSASAQNTKNVTELFTSTTEWNGKINGSTITISKQWDGAGYANWSGVDVSKYASVTAVLKNVTVDEGVNLLVQYVDPATLSQDDKTTKAVESGYVAPEKDGTLTLTCPLDQTCTWPVWVIVLQGKSVGSIEIEKLYLTESAEWNLVKTLDMSKSSWINASEFSSLANDTKVVFTYNVTATVGEVSALVGWGVGEIAGADQEAKNGFCNVQNEGANTAELTVADLKTVLEAATNKDGICWSVWGTSKPDGTAGVTVARVKIEFFTKGTSALRPITAPDAEVVSTTYYNLAGAKLSQPQRGLNIVVRTLSNGSTLTDKVVVK